jgi:hypothetical protein
MTNSDTTLYLDFESSRESYFRIIGTPSALQTFANSVSTAVGALPSPFAAAADIPLQNIEVADGSGSAREVYLTVRAEPSVDWLIAQKRRSFRRDSLLIAFLSSVAVLAVIGLYVVIHWITNVA